VRIAVSCCWPDPLAGACPGPIATQLGQGIAWGVPATAGLVLGILLFRRLQARTIEAHRDRLLR
jgi:hypothetical protein